MNNFAVRRSELKYKTLNGIGWSLVSQVGRQGLAFLIGVILARLLSPHEFGLVAMVTVITNFASIFAELGFSAALVQKKDVTREHLSSVFWLNLGAGLLLTLVFIAGAPLVSAFYSEPLLTPLTMLIATNFFISSLNIVQNTLRTKTLDFRTLSIVEISAVGISGAIAIGMAYAGLGVWSLAAQSVILSTVTAVLLWKLGDWRPSLTFSWEAVRGLLGFSLSLFGTKLLNYWDRNIDYLLIGRFLGTNPLGIYHRAYDVMLVPLGGVSRVLSRVMFPSFSVIQEDKRRVKGVFLGMTRTIALITFPMMLGLFATTEPFVLTIFGPKWGEMIPVLRLFSLMGMMQSIGTLNGNLYLSQGRADVQFRVGLVLKLIPILGIVVGLRWGVIGVAIGYSAASIVCSYPAFFFAGRLVGLTYWELWRNLSGILGCSLTMTALVWGVGLLLPADWPHWTILVVEVLFGTSVYILLIHLFRVRAYQDVQVLLFEQWRLRRDQPGLVTPE